MLKVYFYTKEICPLCEEVYALLDVLKNDYAFEIVERDIYTNDNWLEKYHLIIPAVQINDTFLHCQEIGLESLEKAIQKHV